MPTGPNRTTTPQRIVIRIDEIDLPNRAVHGREKTNVLVVATFRETPAGILHIPAQNERWIAERQGMGQWRLVSRLDSADQQAWAETNLGPGDIKIEGDNIWLEGTVHGIVQGGGTPGLDGLDGSPGPAGPAGSTGSQGVDGTPGLDGLPGEPGPAGLPGLDGSTGPQGTQGIPGLDGLDGRPGTDGLPGIDGLPGQSGPMGLDGLDGSTGPKGGQGLTGNDGLPGIDGILGEPGPAGLPGLDGSTGPSGGIGPQGIDGLDGSFLPALLTLIWDSTDAGISFPVASVTTPSLPTNFAHLMVVYEASGSTTGALFLGMQQNGDTGADYYGQRTIANNSALTCVEEFGVTRMIVGLMGGTTNVVYVGNGQIFIANYANASKAHPVTGISSAFSGASANTNFTGTFSYMKGNTGAAVSSLTFLDTSGTNLAAGCRFSVYGLGRA